MERAQELAKVAEASGPYGPSILGSRGHVQHCNSRFKEDRRTTEGPAPMWPQHDLGPLLS